MRYASWCASLLGLALFVLMTAAPAHAQATRTWVSGVGDDANPCSRTAPCKTFAGAISKTAAQGEINVLDPGGFGAVTITKSITISSEGFEAGVLVSGTNGIVVSVTSSDVVVLRGLDFEGLGTGLNGITFIGGGALHVEKSVIHHFTQNGINFAPNTGGAKLFVEDCYIRENGTNTSTGGIVVRPAVAAGGGNAIVSRVQLDNNSTGVIVDSSNTTVNGISADIRDSEVSGSTNNGLSAISTAAHAAVSMMIDSATLAFNAGSGLNANGTAASGLGSAVIMIGRSSITRNVTGVSVTGSGQAKSYGTNQLNGNNTDGSFTPPNLGQL